MHMEKSWKFSPLFFFPSFVLEAQFSGSTPDVLFFLRGKESYDLFQGQWLEFFLPDQKALKKY